MKATITLATQYPGAGGVTGVWVGWSRVAGYWVHPLLRFLGPVPASAPTRSRSAM